MPHFITYAKYSKDGLNGLMSKPEDRRAAVEALVQKLGGRVIEIYMTTGSNDIVMVSEAPEGADVVAAGMAVAASGSLASIETVQAWTSAEFVAIAERAGTLTGAYTPPGG